MTTSLSDAVLQTERALLGCLLLENSLWPQTEVSVEDFSLDSHRRIFRYMAAMFEDQRPVDIVTLTLELAEQNQLPACGDAAYLASLIDQGFACNFAAYVRQIREAARERRYSRLHERLMDPSETDARLELLQQMQEELTKGAGRQDGRALFHTTMNL